jgi:uncharacterized membrane protein YccF (DUF307 family)
MKTYLVFAKNVQDSADESLFIEESFSKTAMYLNFFWLLINGLWKEFASIFISLVVVATLTNMAIISHLSFIVVFVILGFYLGLSSSEFESKKLIKLGYENVDVIIAKDADEAKYKFFQKISNNIESNQFSNNN